MSSQIVRKDTPKYENVAVICEITVLRVEMPRSCSDIAIGTVSGIAIIFVCAT